MYVQLWSFFQSDPACSEDTRELNLWIPKWLVSFLERGKTRAVAIDTVGSSKLEFTINAESIRFMAYLFFWGMCFFAIALTRIILAPILLAGHTDNSACPPFEISYDADGMIHDKSGGFDYTTNSHLQDAFGFGNVSKIRLLNQDGCLV